MDAYGVATWDGFDTGTLTVAELDRLATEAAGTAQHHLRAVQLPVSLVTASAFAQALSGEGAVAEAANRGRLVYASASLFGGELTALATRELADLIRPSLSVPQACLLAVASCSGVTKVLLSASTPAHWAEGRAAFQEAPVTVPALRRFWMYSPPTESVEQRMIEAFARSAKELAATVGGPEVWGWYGKRLTVIYTQRT